MTGSMAVLAALIYTLTNLIKDLRAGNINAVVTTAAAWLVGIVALALLSGTEFALGVSVAGLELDDANAIEIGIMGLLASSVAATVYDAAKQIGSHSNPPKLLTGETDPTRPS